jgi:hypothetical protein
MKPCKFCGSENVAWGMDIDSNPAIQQNRLNTHDMNVTIHKYCDDCGEQLEVLPHVNAYASKKVSEALEQLFNAAGGV